MDLVSSILFGLFCAAAALLALSLLLPAAMPAAPVIGIVMAVLDYLEVFG